jgi:hypothetical protein
MFPRILKIADFEEMSELGGNVFQKGEDSSFRMFVSEHVKYEVLFCCESISVFRNPTPQVRLGAPS